MRARNIKPGFFENEALAEISIAARLLFIGLWCLADRQGKLADRPKKIKFQLMPLDDIDGDACLRELESTGFIHRYSIDGHRYIKINSFEKHQSPHRREKDSTIPEPDLTKDCPRSVLGHAKDSPRQGPAAPDSLNPDSLNPDSQIQNNKTLRSASHRAPKNGQKKPKAETSVINPTWESYATAYKQRYRTDPVRNAKVNGQLKNFVERVPREEAPAIAAFFVRHDAQWYVQRCHSIDCMLKDAESLRTQWITNAPVKQRPDRPSTATSNWEDIGKQLGVKAKRGETMESFVRRVQIAMGERSDRH